MSNATRLLEEIWEVNAMIDAIEDKQVWSVLDKYAGQHLDYEDAMGLLEPEHHTLLNKVRHTYVKMWIETDEYVHHILNEFAGGWTTFQQAYDDITTYYEGY